MVEKMAEMPPPEELGAFFATQYYGLLSAQPNHMHHFYSEHSTMILVINGDTRTTASELDQIHKLIISLNFVSVEIETVHSRESWGSGVLVVISGYVKIKDVNEYNHFVQTMYLAPQGTGHYFIMNDILHIFNHVNIIRHVKPVAPLKSHQVDPRLYSEHPPPVTDNGNLAESVVKRWNDLMTLMVNPVEFPELKQRQPPPRRRGRFDHRNQPVVREIPYVEDEPTSVNSSSVGNGHGDAMNENIDAAAKVEEEASKVSYSSILSLSATSASRGRGRGNNQRGRGRSSGDSEDKGNQEAEH